MLRYTHFMSNYTYHINLFNILKKYSNNIQQIDLIKKTAKLLKISNKKILLVIINLFIITRRMEINREIFIENDTKKKIIVPCISTKFVPISLIDSPLIYLH